MHWRHLRCDHGCHWLSILHEIQPESRSSGLCLRSDNCRTGSVSMSSDCPQEPDMVLDSYIYRNNVSEYQLVDCRRYALICDNPEAPIPGTGLPNIDFTFVGRRQQSIHHRTCKRSPVPIRLSDCQQFGRYLIGRAKAIPTKTNIGVFNMRYT